MTRDEVMALTDEELRIKAAELMGWRKIPHDAVTLSGPGGEFTGSDYIWHHPEQREDDPAGCELPGYPNDIAAAWELLPLLPERIVISVCSARFVALYEREELPQAQLGENAREITRFIGTDDATNITRAIILAMDDDS